MKKLLAYLLAILFLSGAGGVGSAQNGESSGCNYRRYGLDADKFFLYFTQDTPYTTWQLWPGTGKMRPGKAPHGSFLTTYVNSIAYESIVKGKGMEYGSVIVTENYGEGRQLMGFSAKIKVKGYDPGAGDWHWFAYTADGRATAAGKVAVCLDCHGKMRGNDYLVTAPVK